MDKSMKDKKFFRAHRRQGILLTLVLTDRHLLFRVLGACPTEGAVRGETGRNRAHDGLLPRTLPAAGGYVRP
jgi:hypothetical protein